MPLQPRYERATDGDDGRRRDAQDDADRGVAAEQLLHASEPYSHLLTPEIVAAIVAALAELAQYPAELVDD